MLSLSRSLSTFATLVLMTLAALSVGASSQSFAVLQNFNNANGRRPVTPPILASDGNLYGATLNGGAYSRGVIYKLTPQNQLSTFYTFCSQTNCADGSFPEFGPFQGKDGNLYGTTSNGGANNLGEVYKLTLNGEITVLHSFCLCESGWNPNSLVEDGQGGFYGTTQQSGANGDGAVFHLSAQNQLTTIYSFCDSQASCVNAWDNTGTALPLILAPDGNIYGITTTGGHRYLTCAGDGCGTVFKITPQGEFSLVYSFCSLDHCADGGQPLWMILGSDGNFYGTTTLGGFGTGSGGTVFQLTTSGVLNILHSFTGGQSSTGYAPYDLIEGANGTLYGITFYGGNQEPACSKDGCGTVFSLTTSGDFESLHSFDGSDGSTPAGLVQSSETTLAGTTSYGGTHGYGVIFNLDLN
jgi:uncharacterized repeat protein (TIGR03803 family)